MTDEEVLRSLPNPSSGGPSSLERPVAPVPASFSERSSMPAATWALKISSTRPEMRFLLRTCRSSCRSTSPLGSMENLMRGRDGRRLPQESRGPSCGFGKTGQSLGMEDAMVDVVDALSA